MGVRVSVDCSVLLECSPLKFWQGRLESALASAAPPELAARGKWEVAPSSAEFVENALSLSRGGVETFGPMGYSVVIKAGGVLVRCPVDWLSLLSTGYRKEEVVSLARGFGGFFGARRAICVPDSALDAASAVSEFLDTARSVREIAEGLQRRYGPPPSDSANILKHYSIADLRRIDRAGGSLTSEMLELMGRFGNEENSEELNEVWPFADGYFELEVRDDGN